QQWYDGYIFGNQEIYNPWSVINYISKDCNPQAYWVNAGRNEIIEDVMKVSSDDVYERLLALMQGEKVVARINQTTVYRSLSDDPANIYSILLVAGYLKTVKKQLQADGSYMCEIAIPNNEIFAVYKSEILSYYTTIGVIKDATSNIIAESLYSNDKDRLQKAVGEYMTKSISFYDAGAEGFYHGLVLGLIALMDNQYKIKSNRESGDGRYDVSLFPKDKNNAGIIIEIKWEKDMDQSALSKLADKALKQIDNKHYDSEMVQAGIHDIIKLGMAFSGKEVAIKAK
ncbi:MAG: ATP-binding protein, partial [Butyrivibrio sp.]|nr:ATP-binding protein [Butyrivibrio sp.]